MSSSANDEARVAEALMLLKEKKGSCILSGEEEYMKRKLDMLERKLSVSSRL